MWISNITQLRQKWTVLATLKYMFDYGRKILNVHRNMLLKIVLNSDV